MTQGDQLSPTIFNVVVDAMVRQWESFVAEIAGGDSSKDEAEHPEGRTIRASNNGKWRTEEGHTRLKVKELFLYADKRMVASTNLGWIQTAFDILTGLFDRVGLKTNVRKIVGMACHPCQAGRVRTG